MKKLNSVVYHKILLQAQEAKLQRLNKLSNAVLAAVGPIPEDENVHYEYAELQEDIYQGLWKLATNVIRHHDINSVDVSKVHNQLERLAHKFIEEIESSINVEAQQTDNYTVVGHIKNNPCPKCKNSSFCKDCGVCSKCNYATDPQFGHAIKDRWK